MVRSDRQRLEGEVEIDETFVGGIDHGGTRGRGLASASSSSPSSSRRRRVSGACVSPRSRCLRREPRTVRLRRRRPWLDRAHRRLGWRQRPRQPPRHPQGGVALGLGGPGPRRDAGRAPGGQLAQAMDPRHAPGLGRPRPPAGLPRGSLEVVQSVRHVRWSLGSAVADRFS
jgi:hypothetical protein